MVLLDQALISAAKAKHRLVENDVQSGGLARQSTAKAQHGDDLKSKAKEMQSTDQIGKGSALFRNDTKRHSRDLYRIDLQRKSFDMKGNGNA